MPFDPEAVTSAGSGLVFLNHYDTSVTDAYRQSIIAAEHELESHFTNPLTIVVSFSQAPLGGTTGASLTFSSVRTTYATFAAALRSSANSPDDFIARDGLPATDPSNGAGFALPTAEARALGLIPQTNVDDLDITLNSSVNWSFGQDVIGVLEHEIAEGAFGRDASLGFLPGGWRPMDLFRFNSGGTRDFSGGADNIVTYFGLDPDHVLTSFPLHNGVSSVGGFDGSDMADWDGSVRGDAFGASGPSSPGVLSATDVRVLDVLGWSMQPFTPAPDDFANSLSDGSHPLGQVSAGGFVNGALQTAGDHDWIGVQLQGGISYVINLIGRAGGGGTLADPFLQLHDSSGNLITSNDDKFAGDSDSQIVFTAPSSGAYYIDAGAFANAYMGSYVVSVGQGFSGANDVLQAGQWNTDVQGGAGDDTITGWSGGDVLRGGDGNDSIVGGSGFDDINGNKGDDTISAGAGDWLVGGQGNDSITSHGDNNILYGNIGNDTLIGSGGGEILRGGQGDDSIQAGSGMEWISGDRGNDTIQAGAGPDTFHTFSGAGQDIVFGFKVGTDHVQVDVGTNWTISQSGSDTVIDMGNGDQMILKNVQSSSLPNGWIFTL